ncbi:arginine-tRNA--protein transferase 1 [Hesseltinella vesiculosa]|uniref:Arginyl-tRNA--protein transferase 1 n=1 Tax=Hesseltinella vesiculosa TaxID=101127 RepID=A0A1X2GER7_9FUNG|nr:arginine-tRNA--protein transferase 1 [Hesseltinella vesiculosa]
MSDFSIVSIAGHNRGSCGYCNGMKSSITFGIWAFTLTCEDYQALIDRGWRRSGQYLYKPDLKKSCCPQYTIRMDTSSFEVTKSQRKIITKFNRYMDGSWAPPSERKDTMEQDRPRMPKEKAEKQPQEGDLFANLIHTSEEPDLNKHSFKASAVVLEPASFTEEKYQIYRKYQQEIHHDDPDDIQELGFKNFLVNSPLKMEQDPDNKLAMKWGSYHQKYMLDDKLIAVAVLDILPYCVSSVYFMYDPSYAFLGLGNYSALREISFTRELHTQSPDLAYYYMGYYIHTCKKMQYKGKFHPSDLLDPETYAWYSLDATCRPLLNKYRYVSFANPSEGIAAISDVAANGGDMEGKKMSDDTDDTDDVMTLANDDALIPTDDDYVPPGWLTPSQLDDELMGQIFAIAEDNMAVPVTMLKKYHQSKKMRKEFKDFAAALGADLAKRMIIY